MKLRVVDGQIQVLKVHYASQIVFILLYFFISFSYTQIDLMCRLSGAKRRDFRFCLFADICLIAIGLSASFLEGPHTDRSLAAF